MRWRPDFVADASLPKAPGAGRGKERAASAPTPAARGQRPPSLESLVRRPRRNALLRGHSVIR